MPTPMRPRMTRPAERSCCWTFIASSIGIANEMPLKPPVRREDLRIDADHLAAHVDQRPARIAGVDRDVGLDERQELAGVAAPWR